jgi:chemotaxis protein MotB
MSNKGSGGKQQDAQPIIIIKRVKKVAGHGHHGGAWKVAYADFVTAMMAFFLLLWLLNVTTEDQKLGISNYFAPTMVFLKSAGGGDGALAGRSPAKDGAQAGSEVPVSPFTTGSQDETDDDQGKEHGRISKKALEAMEQAAFQEVTQKLQEAIEQSDLKSLADNIKVDRVPEGLRIQLVDQEKVAMFASGSAVPLDHTVALLQKVAEVIKTMPNRISISGHTDAVAYRGRNNYSNWELSADRANASRRILVDAGYPIKNIMRVEGRAETDPFVKEDPNADNNRRIAVILLKEGLAGTAGQDGKGDGGKNDGAHAKKSTGSSSLLSPKQLLAPTEKP